MLKYTKLLSTIKMFSFLSIVYLPVIILLHSDPHVDSAKALNSIIKTILTTLRG